MLKPPKTAQGNGNLRYVFEDYSLDRDRRELRRGAEAMNRIFRLSNWANRTREWHSKLLAEGLRKAGLPE